MEDLKITDAAWLNETMQKQVSRIQSLVDILYLLNVTWLYIFSLIYPFFGIVFGIILYTGSTSSFGKKIGKICIILGIVNIVLSILIIIVFLILGGAVSKFVPYSL